MIEIKDGGDIDRASPDGCYLQRARDRTDPRVQIVIVGQMVGHPGAYMDAVAAKVGQNVKFEGAFYMSCQDSQFDEAVFRRGFLAMQFLLVGTKEIRPIGIKPRIAA